MYSYTSIKRGIFSDYTIYQDSCNKIFKHFPNFHLHCLFYVENRNLIGGIKEM